ncbi:hypothetical protein HUJ05_003816 [Dendroctonus ponderosae]|nr:hypothetical protein HUJ05_003816 [Dendroctonus ponderosae]
MPSDQDIIFLASNELAESLSGGDLRNINRHDAKNRQTYATLLQNSTIGPKAVQLNSGNMCCFRWSHGLLFHQGAVDCARAALLLPLGTSILHCQPVHKCSLVETAFLLLVTVATVNMLTTVLNDSPVFPDDEDADSMEAPLLMDSPQCVLFGTSMIWFASITINLGPTFLSGALAAQGEAGHKHPSCPLIYGPLRHYILNALWIFVNLVCVFLTLVHLRKLHRDLTKANVEAVRVAGLMTTLVNVTGGSNQMNSINHRTSNGGVEEQTRMRDYLRKMERDGVQRVKMFLVITAAYVLFWGPLFLVTLINHPIVGGNPLGHEITLHISYIHAIVNPTLFLVLHRGLRRAALDACCGWVVEWLGPPPIPTPPDPPRRFIIPEIACLKPPMPAHPDSAMGNTDLSLWSPDSTTDLVLPLDPLNRGIKIPRFCSPEIDRSPTASEEQEQLDWDRSTKI